MKIVGIQDGHSASACLVEDGHIVAAIQEERLRREKNCAGFPSRSIEFVLRAGGRTAGDIDVFAFAGVDMPDQMTPAGRLAFYDNDCFPPRVEGGLFRRIARATRVPALVGRIRARYAPDAREVRLRPARAIGIPDSRTRFLDHHLCHAAGAYYGWSRYEQDILVLTNDGEGDRICATVSIGSRGKLDKLASVPSADSIGNLYAITTFLLGMQPLEHEYKLMGMAPYAAGEASARVARKFSALIEPHGALGWKRARDCPPTLHSYSFLKRLLDRQRFDAVCGGVQSFLEQSVLGWVRRCIAETGLHKVALSGGVFMNVKLNKLLLEMPEVEELFVFPSCGDETNCFGAAFAVQAEQDFRCIPPLGPIYLGGEWNQADIAKEIEKFPFATPVSVSESPCIDRGIASLLASGHIVARFAGRSEFGARALGNRSILADPSRAGVVKTINSMIKSRDFWMPFATTMTDCQALTGIRNPKRVPSPYMILAFDACGAVRDFAAGVHPYDLTVRPQVLERDWNPGFYDLLCEFQRLTGRPAAVLNTSFNLHGFPIVESPADALDVFNRSGLTHLALGNSLIVKQ